MPPYPSVRPIANFVLTLIELRVMNGASDQFNFFTNSQTVRKQTDRTGQRTISMNQSWNNKARVSKVTDKQGAHHTFDNLFTRPAQRVNPLRTEHLM